MRVCLVLGLLFLLALPPARADAQIEFCRPSDRACALLNVPLDRSGGIPGDVTLTIERMRAERAVDPPLFLLADGPGQSATRAFPRDAVEALLGGVLERRRVVVLDQRGTGDSDALRCPTLQRAASAAVPAAVEQCAAALGAGRSFYTTADTVADLEALRAGLGHDSIALFGQGYGAKVALDYAAAHPDRVERLVLQSPVGPGGLDAFHRESFAASTRVLRELCRSGCRRVTPDPVRDLSRLVGRLRRGSIRGAVLTSGGRRTRGALDDFDLFATLAAGDRQPGIRRRFPAAVRAALTGDVAPILRLEQLAALSERAGARTFSAATQAATVCEETALPWDRAAPPEHRAAQADAAVSAQPSGAFAPFDAATARASDVLRLCERWPASGRPTAPAGRLPDVPVLILTGSQDLGTPMEEAQRIASLFPRSQTVVLRGVGRRVLDSDGEGCAAVAVRRFLTDRRVITACPRERLNATGRDPRSLRAVRPSPGTRGRPGRTLAAVRRTYQDALRSYFDLHEEQLAEIVLSPVAFFVLGDTGPRFAAGGLRSGRYVFTPRRGTLQGLGYVPGVRLGGRLRSVSIFPDGKLFVRGRAAAQGTLRVRNGIMSGRLGGRRVRGRLGPDLWDMAFAELLADIPLGVGSPFQRSVALTTAHKGVTP